MTLTELRDLLIAGGWTATSPEVLDADAERMAREDRQD
jgi:hypothetical protein